MNELAKSLAAAQAEMPNAKLNKVNPHFKSKYADLAAIRDVSLPVLAKHKLALTQTTQQDETGFYLETRLMHESGEEIKSRYPLPLAEPQKMGSALTYARRYSWSAMIGITADEDDDGNAAEEEEKKAPGAGVRSAAANGDKAKNWKGPQKKTELQNNLKDMAAQIADLNDIAQLDDLLTTFHDTIEQTKTDMPGWWSGGESMPPDFVPLEERVEAKRRFLESANNLNAA